MTKVLKAIFFVGQMCLYPVSANVLCLLIIKLIYISAAVPNLFIWLDTEYMLSKPVSFRG